MPTDSHQDKQTKSVAFLHPDLAGWDSTNFDCIISALQQKNYKVRVFRPNEKNSKLLSFVPRSFFGHFKTLFVYMRVFLCALRIIFNSDQFDYVIVNQVSLPILPLKFKFSKILFYYENPEPIPKSRSSKDCMSFIYWIWLVILDVLKQLTTGMAHTIIVNSQFSQRQFQSSYPIIAVPKNKKQKDLVSYKEQSILRGHNPQILYPSINFNQLKEE